ncbi:protein FAR1-RELATED SEQUENCE 11-like isoform X2 [Lolium perenne]|uniref:protein FAR1-RELATED SEQUENCE 11-like isoform X2 n=1 Tax=Lolium perenne TaxID=4522 RepID=UPI003A99B308
MANMMMTSTQRSESANHMLRTYMPPGSAMYVFVKQFNKLLYDRDVEESFQEKRTRLGGVVCKVGEPMENHAAKIYMRTMFEKFQDSMYKIGSYYADKVVPGEMYVTTHFDCESREKWCKVQYKVSGSGGYYTCECGMYEHMGMLCCHVLKVQIDGGRARRVAHAPGALPERSGPDDILQFPAFPAIPQLHGSGM